MSISTAKNHAYHMYISKVWKVLDLNFCYFMPTMSHTILTFDFGLTFVM